MGGGVKVKANGISIAVEDTGAGGSQAGRPVALLIMGLGMQLVAWPPAFVNGLVEQGFRVVCFDNRDVGLSEHLDHLGVPNLIWESFKHRMGLQVKAPYSVREMAADALGVLDALGIAQAHVVGVSMGGMIAQRVALAAPQRVLSLTSIMSSSGARHLPGPKSHVLRALLSRPKGDSERAIVDHYIKLFKVIGSPGFPLDEAALRERILISTRRSFHPAGTVRQITAVAADAGRADELARVKPRTLVLHGKDDPLVPFACGHDTARRIPGARLVGIEGMGHDLPPGVVERLLQPLVPHLMASR
jgi:pimeloyl-ACP methyl ester carboxylesterase